MDNMYRHLRTYHGENPKKRKLTADDEPHGKRGSNGDETPSGSSETALQKFCRLNQRHIRDFKRRSKRKQDVYNFETHPKLIQKKAGVDSFLEDLSTADFLEYCRQQRTNTKLVVETITNVMFYVNKISGHPIGYPNNVPPYIQDKRSLISFVTDRHGAMYRDNYCIFRCLAYHVAGAYNEQLAMRLALHYCNTRQLDLDGFPGIRMEELDVFEDIFSINVDVYQLLQELDRSHEPPRAFEYAQKLHSSRCRHPNPPMILNLYDTHFSYVKCLNKYARSYSCKKCGTLLKHHGHLVNHERVCNQMTKLVFPGGGYGPPKGLFDLLLENGINVDSDVRFYPFRAAFDFEAVCVPTGNAANCKETFTHELLPASVSICSNVPGFTEPQCFISIGNPTELVSRMYTYLNEIAQTAYALMSERFADIVAELEEMTSQHANLLEQIDYNVEIGNASENGDLRDEAYRINIFVQLSNMLDRWLKKLVVLGFNSAKFDFNLIRKYLFPHMLNIGDEIGQIIKKNNEYLSVETPSLLFLDIKNYLAAGTSYAKWIKSQDVGQQKGFFPYQWFDDLKKLDCTHLPPIEAFWSELKQKGISQDDYTYICDVWQQNRFSTMRDFLIWYNNLDVQPFILAAEKMFLHWKTLGIDPFKSGVISLPGLALAYMMQAVQPHTILPLFNDQFKDIYHTMRDNVVGGLSVVTHRYHEADVTPLPNGKLCKWIYSHDCNALYLWALGEPTGTGIIDVWRPSNDIGVSIDWKRHNDVETAEELSHRILLWDETRRRNLDIIYCKSSTSPNGKSELEWLEWTIFSTNSRIEHKFNGRQKTVYKSFREKFPVDGYCPDSNTVYQFHGCFWHGHDCHLGSRAENKQERYENTQRISAYLRSVGYNVVEKWECEWIRDKLRNDRLRAFLKKHFLKRIKSTTMTGGQIVDAIRDEKLFGFIECDLEVPFFDRDLLSYYAEFPPVCKNTDISIDDIGPFMANYARTNGYMKKPRRGLINSFWGRKLLLATPIVRWYLQHGLKVTRIYQVFEMCPKRAFAQIRDSIADHRRRADRDPAYKSVGESWKTVGNSCYGKSITNKEKHKDTRICNDEEAGKLINKFRFHKMEEVGDEAYEVCLDKKNIKMNLPITIAKFVYNYAKLRMLEFVYDFLKKYLRQGSYQIVCSDTDSIIAAYEDSDLDTLVKPHMVDEYHAHGKSNFLVTDSYTLRTPGLFKEEWSGRGIVALCSKTYVTWNDDDVKISSKGLSKATNSFKPDDFKRVLATGQKGTGINYGFRYRDGKVLQYQQSREGLGYLYVKRKVRDDGIGTDPLDL